MDDAPQLQIILPAPTALSSQASEASFMTDMSVDVDSAGDMQVKRN